MKQRLGIAASLGGVAAIVVLGILIIGPGRHHPSPPSLEDHPNTAIPGEILWIDSDSCIIRAAASGSTRTKVYCPGRVPGLGPVTWLENGGIGYISYGSRGPALIEIDLASRQERDTGRTVQTDGKFGPGIGTTDPLRGDGIVIDEDGDVFLVSGGERARIASFDVPRHNPPQLITWSPDRQWILLRYYSRSGNGSELWLLSRDGKTAGTLARDLEGPSGASWRIEGKGFQPPLSDITPVPGAR